MKKKIFSILTLTLFTLALLSASGNAIAGCAEDGSVTVTTDQPYYWVDYTVEGDIIFTNNRVTDIATDVVGNIYDSSSNLLDSNTLEDVTIPPGESSYLLSDLFGTVTIDETVLLGDYTFEVVVTETTTPFCEWSDTTIVTVGDTLTVPAEYSTIQGAINAAATADLVLVSAGTYEENITIAKDITVRSVSGEAATIIDGTSSGSVVTFSSGAATTTMLDGFTITNGTGTTIASITYGGGIYCDSTSPTIQNCTISNCNAERGGGIICTNGSSPTIDNCTITGNTSPGTGGGGILCLSSSSPAINNCTITQNHASKGAGINCISSSSPTITNCTITNNVADMGNSNSGGGIYLLNYSDAIIKNCNISGNEVYEGSGGGIYSSKSSPTITDCAINNNIIYNTSTASLGGGISLVGSSSATITDCTINNNIIHGESTCTGAGVAASSSTAVIKKTYIQGNSSDFGGGGITAGGYGNLTLENCVITDNTAISSAGIWIGDRMSPVLITNCTVSNNSAEVIAGGLFTYSMTTITNSIFYGNSGVSFGGSEIYTESIDPISINFTNIDPDEIAGSGTWTGGNNINADPLFNKDEPDPPGPDPTKEPYYILRNSTRAPYISPCIDYGTSTGAPGDDILSVTRPQGSGHDMGAYENNDTP
jgi:hypothetical protein